MGGQGSGGDWGCVRPISAVGVSIAEIVVAQESWHVGHKTSADVRQRSEEDVVVRLQLQDKVAVGIAVL